MALLLKQCKLITSCFCSPVNQINTGASSDYCLHNGCLGDDPQLSLSMDREVWRGERGGLYLYFTPSVHKKSPQSVSIKHWNSIHSSVPALPPLTWSVLHRLRLLSELTILTWKKISNKDICDPIRQLGPHSPGAPPGIYCYGNDVICKLTSSSAWGDFSNDIIDQESFSRHPLIWIPNILWPPCCFCPYEGFKATRYSTQGSAKICESFPKCES